MAAQIFASVGAGGRNSRADVDAIQRALHEHGMSVGVVDGICGPRTVGAIIQFQKKFMHKPDGRVDPGGVTQRQLSSKVSTSNSLSQPTATIEQQALVARIPRPPRETLSSGLIAVTPGFMIEQLGHPRQSYSTNCQPVTNPTLQRNMVT